MPITLARLGASTSVLLLMLAAPTAAEPVRAGGDAPAATRTPAQRTAPLAGRVVMIDPGHQLGNHNFPRQINAPVPDGRGGSKACNTTGTATNGGYPEATFAWKVARLVRARLVGLGATVRMTRHENSQDAWGPCVDRRGRAGNRVGADAMVSIHADGNTRSGARGFHVIVAPDRSRGSRPLALATRAALQRAGFRVANYIAGGDGLDVRRDLATLNFSRVPTVMAELGNMRDRRDAGRMTSPSGRAAYAAALASAVRRYLG